ncbi:hypothetical protein [Ralstonia pseudosolanacearum]
MTLFDQWTITISSNPMPSDGDGETKAITNGRNKTTAFYSNTPADSSLVAHEFMHLLPQNVNKKESGSSYAILSHNQRPWEREAIELSRSLNSGGDICGALTGEPLGVNPVEQYYREYDYRPFWKRLFNVR